MQKEVFDLLPGNVRQVGIVLDLGIALRELGRGNRDDLLVAAAIVFHAQDADRLHVDDRAGDDRAGIGDEHVDGVAIIRERVRHEAVIPGVAHGGIEEAVDDQRAGFLVHLVLDRLAADRHLDDDVDVVRGVLADRKGVDAHGETPDVTAGVALAAFAAPHNIAVSGIDAYRHGDFANRHPRC